MSLPRRICQIKRNVASSSGLVRHHSEVRHLSSDSQKDGAWLYKLDEAQKMFLYGHRNGARFNTQIYTLNARKPLSPDVVEQALKHLQRISPVHNVVIREKEDEFWCYRPKEVDVDFKVLAKGTSKFDAVRDTWKPFDEVNGPLYRACLVAANPEDECLFPDVKEEFPHQYYLVKCQHHSVIDASSGFVFMYPMIGIIDALAGGGGEGKGRVGRGGRGEGEGRGDYDHRSTIGELVSGDEYGELFARCKEKLLKDSERLESLRGVVVQGDKVPLLIEGFSRPCVDKPETKHSFINLKPFLYRKFLDRCKENQVTFGNAFQTVINTSLIELVQEASGTSNNSYDLSTHYSVNLRRYMRKRQLPVLGFHVRTMMSLVTMEKNVRDNPWNNCRMVHQINTDLLDSKGPIEQEVIRKLFLHQVPPEEFFKHSPPVIRDYGYNNMGSIPSHSSGRHVQMTEVENYQTLQRFIYPFYCQSASYGGKFRITLSYATDWVSDDTADLLVKKIKEVMEFFTQK